MCCPREAGQTMAMFDSTQVSGCRTLLEHLPDSFRSFRPAPISLEKSKWFYFLLSTILCVCSIYFASQKQSFSTNFFRFSRVDGVHAMQNVHRFLLLADREQKFRALRQEAETNEIDAIQEAAAQQIQTPWRYFEIVDINMPLHRNYYPCHYWQVNKTSWHEHGNECGRSGACCVAVELADVRISWRLNPGHTEWWPKKQKNVYFILFRVPHCLIRLFLFPSSSRLFRFFFLPGSFHQNRIVNCVLTKFRPINALKWASKYSPRMRKA